MACCCTKSRCCKVPAVCLGRCDLPRHKCLNKEEVKPGPVPKHMGWLYTARDAPQHQLRCGWRPGHITNTVLRKIAAHHGKCGICPGTCSGTCSKPNLKPCGIPPKCSAPAQQKNKRNSVVAYSKSEPQNPETNKSDLNKSEFHKSEANKSEANKSEANKSEANKSEANKSETNKSEANQSEANKSEANKPQANKSEANKPQANKSEPYNSEPCKSEPCKYESYMPQPCKPEPCRGGPCCTTEPSAPYLRVIRHAGRYSIITDPPDNSPSGPYPLKYVLNCDPNDKDEDAKFSLEAKYNDYCFDYTSSQTSFVLDFSPPEQRCYKSCPKDPCNPCNPGCLAPC